ncbi:uncharacterized protein LOC144342555 [Saccoglossus kowalevskii]
MFGDTTSYYPVNSNIPVDAPIGILSDQELFGLAMSIGGNWKSLATTLLFSEYEIGRIERQHLPEQHCFAMLLNWRYTCIKMIRVNDSVLTLANALESHGHLNLANYVLDKYQRDLYCA